MKTKYLILPVLLGLASSALAWPFVKQTGGYAAVTDAFRQHLAIQTDKDRPLEMFGGGFLLQQTTVDPGLDLVHTNVSLPMPDKDPYPSNNAAVGFETGRGDAGDFDGDGDTDLVYSALVTYNNTAESQNVRILSCRNNGDGTWTRVWQLKEVSAPTVGAPEVKLADLDRDGDLDLIEAYNGIRIRWNPGDGNFNEAPVVLRNTAFPYAPEIEVADFDGNGWVDIALVGGLVLSGGPYNTTGRVELLSNTGGVFTTSSVFTNPSQVDFDQAAAADLNGDGRVDLITTRFTTSGGTELQWFHNTGSGFLAPVLLLALSNAQASYSMAFVPGDVNGDGITDLAFCFKSGEVQWLRGLGNGGFSAAAVLIASNGTPNRYLNLCLADRDGDGDPDISMSGTFYENTTPHMGGEVRVEEFPGATLTGAVDLTVGDVNNDGKDDLVVTDPGAFPSPRLRWYAGNGNGLNAPLSISSGSLPPLSVTTGDFNGDGRTDLAWTTTGILTQALSTSATGSTFTTTNIASMSGITRIMAEDMDRDGDTDILSVSPTAGMVRIHSNNGTGSAWLPQNVETSLISPDTLAAGQLISGGRPEIALLRADAVDIYHHSPVTGWDGGGVNYQFGATGSRAVLVADIDGTKAGPETFFALNDNTIRYWSENPASLGTLFTSPQPVKQLAAADWDADGFLDLLVATTAGVNLYRNPNHTSGGDPLNPTAIPLLTGVSILDLVTLDLNGDGFTDAVAVDTTGQLQLLYNGSSAVKITTVTYFSQSGPAGSPVTVARANAVYQGNSTHSKTQGAAAAPEAVKLRFFRSTPVGGVDAPGTSLTAVEVAALMDSIFLVNQNGYPLQTEPAATGFGDFTLNLTAGSRQSLSMAKGQSGTSYEIRLNLKATAASAPVTRFYVEHDAASPWVALDAAGAVSPTPLRLTRPAANQRTLVVVFTPSAFQNWRFSNFGTYYSAGNAANDADPDRDNLPNIMEYVMGRDPNSGGGLGSNVPLEITFVNRGTPVQLDLRVLTTYDSRIKLTLQSSTTMGSWSTLSTRTGTGAWSTAPSSSVLLGGGGRTLFKFNASGTPQSTFSQSFRIKAEETP